MAKRKLSVEHESAEFAARRIALIGVGMAVTLIVLSAIIFAVVHPPRSAQRNAFVVGGGDVPAPRLQAAPIDDYAHYAATKRAQLESTGWVDREHHIAHIPIEQAMDDIARQTGLVVVVVIGVEKRVAELVEDAAVELVGARAGDELDLRQTSRFRTAWHLPA